MSVVFATMILRELVKVAKAFPSKCNYHYSVITPELQTSFEQFVASANNEVFAAANKKHGMQCAFHGNYERGYYGGYTLQRGRKNDQTIQTLFWPQRLHLVP